MEMAERGWWKHANERKAAERNVEKGGGRTKNPVAPTAESLFFMNIRTRANKFECARRKGRQTWSGSPFAVDRFARWPGRVFAKRVDVHALPPWPWLGCACASLEFEGEEGQVRLWLPYVEEPSKTGCSAPTGSTPVCRRLRGSFLADAEQRFFNPHRRILECSPWFEWLFGLFDLQSLPESEYLYERQDERV